MNLFQILALIVLSMLLVFTLIALVNRWVTRRETLIWSVVWMVAGWAVVRPEITGVVARMLGIGRGADLILYCSVVVMMIGFMMVYVRLRRLRHDMTLLVRELAIREPFVSPDTQIPSAEL